MALGTNKKDKAEWLVQNAHPLAREWAQHLAKVLIKARTAAGLTPTEVADALDMSDSWYYGLESAYHLTTMRNIARLADLLDIPLQYVTPCDDIAPPSTGTAVVRVFEGADRAAARAVLFALRTILSREARHDLCALLDIVEAGIGAGEG